MKHCSIFVVCAMLAIQASAQDNDSNETDAIRALSKQYAVAIRDKDRMALNHILADNYSQVSFDLRNGDKDDAIHYFTMPSLTFETYGLTDVVVRVDGDTAVETGKIHATGEKLGLKAIWSGMGYSRVWLKRDGVWRILHEHHG